jgi:outer membrane usher protein FimD/PapC
MKRNKKFLAVGICALLLVAMLAGTALLAAEVTITGTISEEGIVADDGQVYAVAENDKGEELMELVNKKVQVTGTVEEAEGKKVITITDFKVIE